MHASAELLVASAMRDASNNRIQCLVLDHQCVFGISCQNGRKNNGETTNKTKGSSNMHVYICPSACTISCAFILILAAGFYMG